MEALEPRNLLSLSILLAGADFENPSATAAEIHGSADADLIQVFYDPVANQLTVNRDVECIVLDTSITRVHVYAGDGDDVVQVRGGVIDYFVDGGNGNDTITGSSGADWIQGGSGNDWIAGALGADYLVGADGLDTLTGGSGGDVLVGGADADELFGGFGWDVIDWDATDLIVRGEDTMPGNATPPDAVLDPDEVVT